MSIVLATTIPVKLHSDAAQFVREDLLTGRADYERRLRSLDERLSRPALGPELLRAGHGHEGAVVAGRTRIGQRFVVLEQEVARGADHQVFPVLVGARVIFERHQETNGNAAGVRLALCELELAAKLVDPDGCVVLTIRLLLVEPG